MKGTIEVILGGRLSVMTAADMKQTIRYSRTYRYLMLNKIRTVLLFVFFVLPASAFWAFFSPEVTRKIAEISERILSTGLGAGSFTIGTTDFSSGEISYLLTEGMLPDVLFSLGNFLLTLAVLFVLTFFLKVRPVSIFLYIALLVQLCSCLFFIFFPELFPYSLSEYSDLYMKQQIGIFICMTFVMGCVTSFLPIAAWKVIAAVVSCGLYSFVFSIVRYTTFLFLMKEFSVLYMACMFFTFGPLIDFLYLVAIYSLLADHTSGCLAKDMEVWQW